MALAGPLALLGCDEGAEAAASAAPRSAPSPAAAPAAPPDPAAPLRQLLSLGLGAELTDLAASEAWRAALERGLSEQNPYNLASYRRDLLGPLYRESGYHPVFTRPEGGLHDRARPLLRELRAAYQHALDQSPYRIPELDALEARLLEVDDLPAAQWPIDGEVIDTLAEQGVSRSLSGDEALPRLARLAAGLEGAALTPALVEAFEARRRAVGEAIQDSVRFELVAVNAFMSYAYDMRHFNTERLSFEQLRDRGGQVEVQRERLRESFREAAQADIETFDRQLEALIPQVPQYPLLMTSLARYREIVDAGGWERVAPRSLRLGSSQSRVGQLKRRLAIEGFYEGPIDNQFDQALADAVASYQESHQMEVTGETHDMFWRSLNVPAQERLQQVELALQRWRETRLADEPYYIYVNVPDFHAEVWRDGGLQYRFRVVVGNNNRQCSPETGRMELVNATPLFSAQLEYMVFNPYWNVPPRIRQDELDLELAENPNWLQENGFEVVVDPSGPRIRQLPGEGNALGAVKFVFPNIHNVYMHDTPLRRYFEFPIRDYSHGCIRVHEPMRFAEQLLSNDGNWDPERIQRLRESGVETAVRLDTSVPIHIEYHVVRVDELGRTRFLADIYRYDRERLGQYEPDSCTVPHEELVAEQVELVQWNDDGTAVIPDGTVIHPDGTVEYSEARLLTEGQPSADGRALTASDGQLPLQPRRLERRPASEDDGTRPVAGDLGP